MEIPEYEFINATIEEKIVDGNKINFNIHNYILLYGKNEDAKNDEILKAKKSSVRFVGCNISKSMYNS